MNRQETMIGFEYSKLKFLWIRDDMPDQKVDNLLNLAMDATEAERRKSENLNIGYDPGENRWDVIVKYSGSDWRREYSGSSIAGELCSCNFA